MSTSGLVGQRLADAAARAEDEVDDAGRHAGLLEQLDEDDRRQRRQRTPA